MRQLSAYVCNVSHLWPTGVSIFVLGVLISPTHVCVRAFFGGTEAQRLTYCDLLCQTERSDRNASAVMCCIPFWCHEVCKIIAAGDVVDYAPRVVRMMKLDGGAPTMFKLYRTDPDHRESWSRRATISASQLQGSIFPLENLQLQLLQYPAIPGDHVPKHVGHLIGVLLQVRKLQDLQIVHGDIRWFNVIVKLSNQDACVVNSECSAAEAPSQSSATATISPDRPLASRETDRVATAVRVAVATTSDEIETKGMRCSLN